MDVAVRGRERVRILVDTRPALDKHAGIPQQTRLLFRGLSLIDDFEVEGLLQSGSHALGSGVPTKRAFWQSSLPSHKRFNRMARVVIMLEQKFWRSYISVLAIAFRRLFGASEGLTLFEANSFRDFTWRRLFAKSLPPSDFDIVTRASFRIARSPWTAMHVWALLTRNLGHVLLPKLRTTEFDFLIAETPYPADVSKGSCLIIRYHDAIPLLLPHTISQRKHHQAFHYNALRANVESGAWFVCVSEATRRDLLSVFPELEARSVTIHNIVSEEYFDAPTSATQVHEIVRTRLNPKLARSLDASTRGRLFAANAPTKIGEYLLIVSTIEPRKNHLTLLSAWEKLRAERFPDLKLLLVGSLGWHQRPIIRKFMPWIERGEAFALEDVPSPELRLLYKHARATICPSVAEGFDLSGVEAQMSGGVVVASDIPVHQEVYSKAAEYFNPYSVEDLVTAIDSVISSQGESRRAELVMLGRQNARRFTYEAILPKWHSFLTMRSHRSSAQARSPQLGRLAARGTTEAIRS